MICKNCGNQVADGMKFCPECGSAMTTQPDEALTGEIVEIKDSVSGDGNTPIAKGRTRKYNIGHLGVLIASLLTLIATFMPNSGTWGSYTIIIILSRDNKGDGRTYVMILAILLIATVMTGYLRRNMLTVIASIASTAWIVYMFIICGESPLKGMGILLFLIGGILLVVSSIAAFKISRNQQA